MWCVWIGLALAAMKVAAIGPVAQWSWWWVLSPLAAALAWFEGLERLFGRDRRETAHGELQQRQRQRAREAFEKMAGPKRRPKRGA